MLRGFGLSGLACCLALGLGMPTVAAAKPPPAAGAPDLDFEADLPPPGGPDRLPAGERRPPRPAAAALSEASSAWIYWTLGLSAAAVAGGAAWYLHDAQGEAPRQRTEVFTDAAD